MSVRCELHIKPKLFKKCVGPLSKACDTSISFYESTPEEIAKIIGDFELGKASDIPLILIKKSRAIISPVLSTRVRPQKNFFWAHLLNDRGHRADNGDIRLSAQFHRLQLGLVHFCFLISTRLTIKTCVQFSIKKL